MAWPRAGPRQAPSCRVLVIPEASGVLIFYIILPGFIGHFNYWINLKYKNSRKQELATRCTELIGYSKYAQKCMKVQAKHGKVTQNMHGARKNCRYVWDVSLAQTEQRL